MLLARGLRKKKVDVDKPEGYIKFRLRRWWRREIARWSKKEIEEELVCKSTSEESFAIL